jgi:hypothetical protein
MIDFTIRYTPTNLTQEITDLPRNVRGPAIEAAAIYLVGDGTRGLRHYPIYRYASRTAAYGRPFQSEKQRRWFFAALRRGEILPGFPRRTGRLQRGWTVIPQGVRTRIVNSEPYSIYVVGDPGQARQPALAGWRRYGLIIASNQNGMIQAADRKAQEVIRARGL